MVTNFKASYIMPYWHEDHNLRFLKNNINQLLSYPDIEIVVVEVGPVSKLKNLDMKSKVVFLQSNTWDLGWAFNCGVKHTSSSNIFFGSFEVLPDVNTIKNQLKEKENYDLIILQDGAKLADKNYITNKQTTKELSSSTGVYFFDYKSISAVSGWDENLSGDQLYLFQKHKSFELLNVKIVEDTSCVILPVSIPEDNKKDEIFEKIIDLKQDKLKLYLNKQNKKITNPNKYRKIPLLKYHV